MPCPRLSIAGLSPRRPVFDHRPVRVAFMVNTVALVRVFTLTFLLLLTLPITLAHLQSKLCEIYNDRVFLNALRGL